MKRSKILTLILTVALLIGMIAAVSLSSSAAILQGAVVESDWISTPEKQLKLCEGENCDHVNCYDYSFAVVGDTQNIAALDVINGESADASKHTAYLKTLYQWIKDNQKSKNIQYVMGLGDITQAYYKNYKQSGVYTLEGEWTKAAEAIKILDDANIPYSLVRGNHDISANFNETFGKGTEYYTDLMALVSAGKAGILNSNKIEDTWRLVEANGDKYIVFTLDWHPTEECLKWVDETLTTYKDYKAIITVHSFLWYDGSLTIDANDVFPYENTAEAGRPDWAEISKTGGNETPDEIWATLKKHANVEMILCGHVDHDDIVTTQLIGDNGNTVTAMLIDGQTVDKSATGAAGLVAMFYFKNDGTVMDVEYISTYREANGKPAYLKDKNQFDVNLELSTSEYNQYVYDNYGAVVTTEAYNAHPFHFVIDTDSDITTANNLYGSFDSWEDVLKAIDELNSKWNTEARDYKSFYVVMSKNYTDTFTGVHNSDAKHTRGAVVIDLCDNTLTLASNGEGDDVFLPFYHSAGGTTPHYTIKNGNINITGESFLIVTSGSQNTTGDVHVLDLEDLNITYNPASGVSSKALVSRYTGAGTNSIVDLNVTDCNIDFSKVTTDFTLFNLNDPNNNNHVDLTITGGSIKGNQTTSTTLFKMNDFNDTVTFEKDENGNYPTVTFNNNATAPGTVGTPTGLFFSETEGTSLEFGAATEYSGSYKYPLVASTKYEINKYGVVDITTYPLASNPVVIMKGGKAILGFSKWSDFSTALNTNADLKTGCVMLLRKDFASSDKNPNVRLISDITIDMNGHTLSRGSAHLFEITGASTKNDPATKITFKNGTVAATGGTFIVANASKTTNINKQYEFIFDGVTVDATKGLFASYNDGTVRQKISLKFNDCTFTNVKNQTLFDLDDATSQVPTSKDINDVSVVINGGSINASSADFTLANYDTSPLNHDSLTLGKGKDGKMPIVYLPASVTPSKSYPLTSGNHYLVKTADGSGYEFTNLSSPYGGDIYTSKASAIDYPFAVYYNGSFKSAYTTWTDAMSAAIKYVDTDSEIAVCDTVYVVLRRDFQHKTGAVNLKSVKGKIVVDLNGYQLSAVDAYKTTLNASTGTYDAISTYLTDSYINYNDNANNAYLGYASELIIKNGILRNERSSYSMFNIGDAGNAIANRKQLIYTFDAVTFRTTENPIMHAWDHTNTTGIDIKVNLNDCIFDFSNLYTTKSGVTTANAATLFSFTNADAVWKVDIEMKTCAAAKQDATAHKIYAIGSNDTVKTIYGLITGKSFAEVDRATYPVALFNDSGFVGLYTDLAPAYTQMLKAPSESYTIVIRRDMIKSANVGTANFTGSLVLDLNGHDVSVATAGNYLFDVTVGAVTNTNEVYASYTIKNGSLTKVGGRGFALVTYNKSLDKSIKFNFSFDNVTLRSTDSTFNTNVAFCTWEGGFADLNTAGSTAVINVISSFNNCTFDYANSISGAVMLPLNHATGDRVIHNVTVNGGEVIANNSSEFTDKFAISNNNNNGRADAITYGKGLTITLPFGSAAPAGEYNGLVFVLDSATADTVTYKLAPKAPVVYTPKSSVTLWTDFVYNVYLPATSLTAATLNGTGVDLNALGVINIDGVDYYKLPINLKSGEALEDINLGVTVSDGSNTYNGIFTFSIYDYAVAVVTGSATDAEKALVKDMLSYAKAAYTYFGSTCDKFNAVDALLSGYSSSADMTPSASATTPEGTGFTGVTFHLGDAPAYRFYYEGTAPSYTFTVGERRVAPIYGTDKSGSSYIEIKVYAYELLLGVSFGEHTYSAYAYYAWASSKEMTAETALVERLINYCEAASAFKASVATAN